MKVAAAARPGTKRAREDRASVLPVAPSLADLQSRFQKALMDGDDSVLALIPGNSRTDREVLIGVYRHAYVARLVDIAISDFPILSAFMGEAAFRDMARLYLKEHPSRQQNARWFANELPEFLCRAAPFQERPELGEIALIERALNDAFDAEDAPVLALQDLARHAPERWGELAFVPHASAQRLRLGTNAFDIWRAAKDGAPLPQPMRLDESEQLLVWRNGTISVVRALAAEEAMMWDEAGKGVRFAVLCELAATFDDPDGAALRAAQYLQTWISAGLLSQARLQEKSKRRRR